MTMLRPPLHPQQPDSTARPIWMLHPAAQQRCIRALVAQHYSPETISTIARLPLSAVRAMAEVRS